MNSRHILIVALSFILVGAVLTGVVNAIGSHRAPVYRAELSNVRDYAASQQPEGNTYAVDGGVLFQSQSDGWSQIATPQNVIVGAVAVDAANPGTLYAGAANEMAIYRSANGGADWVRIPLSADYIGGVTDIAVDSTQRIIYVGTDTAGLFRLRDVGSSVILTGQLLLDEPVIEVVTDNSGAGMAFARTRWNLYRAENYGLSWATVDNLHSVPTALAIAETQPASVFVGTVDRGLLTSHDGLNWVTANEGLGLVPGSRLQVDALSVDPAQPDVLYVATSFLYGTNPTRVTPVGVSMSTDGAQAWTTIDSPVGLAVAQLLPVSGNTGAILALTTESRTPLALGNASAMGNHTDTSETSTADVAPVPFSAVVSWLVAALAAMALLFAIVSDLRNRRIQTVRPLAVNVVHTTS